MAIDKYSEDARQQQIQANSIRSTRPQHELHDSPWVWLAGPVLLLGVLALGWVRMKVGV